MFGIFDAVSGHLIEGEIFTLFKARWKLGYYVQQNLDVFIRPVGVDGVVGAPIS